MRKIVVAEYISLDGVVEAPENWHFEYFNDEMQNVVVEQGVRSDTMLLGRVTYDAFAGAFAHAPADNPVAELLAHPTKVVASRTLSPDEPLEWVNSVVLRGDLIEQAAELKAGDGGDILVTGSVSVVRQLLTAGLVDELSLLVHPVVLGSGQRLFDGLPKVPLALDSCTAFSTGVTHQTYRPA